MKVFFTASFSAKGKYQPVYDEIVSVLKKKGVEVISLEVQSYSDLLGEDVVKKLTKEKTHYQYIKKGIAKADAVIIESSTDKFRLGHEATVALFLNKPVLCLSDNKDYSENIKHHNFYSAEYGNKKEMEDAINEFLHMCEKKYLPVRFNGFFSPEQMNFLKWYSHKNGSTVSELLRSMVNEKMNTTDMTGFQTGNLFE